MAKAKGWRKEVEVIDGVNQFVWYDLNNDMHRALFWGYSLDASGELTQEMIDGGVVSISLLIGKMDTLDVRYFPITSTLFITCDLENESRAKTIAYLKWKEAK